MNTTVTLTRHRDIQTWVSTRHGLPAIARVRNPMGELRAKLAISFARPKTGEAQPPSLDDGLSPCSWTAWLAELDRQHLALKVTNGKQPAFEFVERKDLN